MEIEYNDYDNLLKARKIQSDCMNLNIIPPPVISYEMEVKDSNEEIIKKVFAKSNSYVRNAYNIIAALVGVSAINVALASYVDGNVSFKPISGTSAITLVNDSNGFVIWNNRSLLFGSGTTPDNLNNYTIESTFAAGVLTYSTVASTSVFDQSTRRLITRITVNVVNTKAADALITESVLFVNNGNGTGAQYLLIRDVFPTIALKQNQSLTFTYQTEVGYPL